MHLDYALPMYHGQHAKVEYCVNLSEELAAYKKPVYHGFPAQPNLMEAQSPPPHPISLETAASSGCKRRAKGARSLQPRKALRTGGIHFFYNQYQVFANL